MSSAISSAAETSISTDKELSNTARMLSATIGALITSLVVTPFDVVKTRLQAQIHLLPGQNENNRNNRLKCLYDSCTHYKIQTGLVDVWCHKCDFQAEPPYPHANNINNTHNHSISRASPLQFNNSIDAFLKLIRFEGTQSLWRGLSPTLIHSIPSTVIYFWGYDNLKIFFTNYFENSPHISNDSRSNYLSFIPLMSGVSARALATITVSPIELVKTKSQSLNRSVAAMSIVRAELNKGGLKSLWRGAAPTLWRDVPFSAIYWSSYEYIKRQMTSPHSHSHQDSSRLMWTSFVSGASSGMMAAAITHPFDLVKTRRQIEMYDLQAQNKSNPSNTRPASSTGDVFRTIIREEGYRGLSAGLAARMGKIAPACAIMITTYELAKAKFGQSNHNNNNSHI